MAASTELPTLQSAPEIDQDKVQLDPQLESNSSSPSNTPGLGAADPAPIRRRGRKRFPRRGYFDVRDLSKVEIVGMYLSILMFLAEVVLALIAPIVPHYTKAYSSLLTATYILRLFDKWYRVQGGFDTFNDLLDDFRPGAFGLIIALWGNNYTVLFAVNVFSVCFQGINIAIQWFQSCIKIPIKGNVKKFLRAKQLRDRYEDIGISGLLPCNEATNKIIESPIIDGEYYTLEKVDHETPVKDGETDVNDGETPAPRGETPASLTAKKERNWIIGTMMVSYSDNGKWVTINQKAEDRAVKTFMERFTEEQKCNFIRMMKVWKKRPDQGILKKIRRKRSHCFNLARLIDLTNQGFSVCSEKTDLRRIKVGAEADTGVEDFIDSIWEVLEVVYNHAARQNSIIVAIVAVVVMFNLSTV